MSKQQHGNEWAWPIHAWNLDWRHIAWHTCKVLEKHNWHEQRSPQNKVKYTALFGVIGDLYFAEWRRKGFAFRKETDM